MSFTNSEQLYGVNTVVISGTGAKGIQDGPGVLFSVTTSIAASGSIAVGGVSGVVLALYNARSGTGGTPAGVGGALYYFNGGTASGVGTGGLPVMPPDQWGPQPFTSGLSAVVSGSAGFLLTVTYRAGI